MFLGDLLNSRAITWEGLLLLIPSRSAGDSWKGEISNFWYVVYPLGGQHASIAFISMIDRRKYQDRDRLSAHCNAWRCLKYLRYQA
ncbi:hypothetical protein FPV67DRAFT_1485230 [Lyophyllum atratum]|nr:hypothetical protein FPV67DRAFT_1485230 [Lyophyllum atratum]